MIRIAYSPAAFSLSIRGHAGAAPAGEDLVCSAVSALAVTAAANANALKARGLTRQTLTRLEPGLAQVICIPTVQGRGQVRQVMDAVCLGFAMLAAAFPEYVRYVNQAEG